MLWHNKLNLFGKILVLSILIVSEIEGAERAITRNEILQTQQLRKHLETLKGHLQDTIEKIDHNIKARQAEFETEIQTPDGGEFIKFKQKKQNNTLRKDSEN